MGDEASSSTRFFLKRAHRLRGREVFDAAFKQGTRRSRGPLVLHARPNELAYSRLGLAVPRSVGTAARRNRIKRLLRESFRLLQHELPTGLDLVLLVRPHEPLKLADYQQLLREILAAL